MAKMRCKCHDVLQVRQHTEHKRTFMFLEQVILKYNAAGNCINIKDIHEVLFYRLQFVRSVLLVSACSFIGMLQCTAQYALQPHSRLSQMTTLAQLAAHYSSPQTNTLRQQIFVVTAATQEHCHTHSAWRC